MRHTPSIPVFLYIVQKLQLETYLHSAINTDETRQACSWPTAKAVLVTTIIWNYTLPICSKFPGITSVCYRRQTKQILTEIMVTINIVIPILQTY